MGAQQCRGDITTQRVLDGALRCVEEGGVSGLTIQGVHDQAGVSVGSIYHHFGNLQGVGVALYERSLNRLMQALVTELKKATTAQEGIFFVVQAYLDWTEGHEAEARVVHQSPSAIYMREWQPRKIPEKQDLLGEIAAFFQPYLVAGELLPMSPFIFEMLIIGPVAEVSRRWLGLAGGVDLRAARQSLPGHIWRSVASDS